MATAWTLAGNLGRSGRRICTARTLSTWCAAAYSRMAATRRGAVSVATTLPVAPTWAEMEAMKRWVVGTERVAYQVHPPVSEYVNDHPYVLHIWAPLERLLGRTGVIVITRLLGMLLAALSVQFVIDGVRGTGLIG